MANRTVSLLSAFPTLLLGGLWVASCGAPSDVSDQADLSTATATGALSRVPGQRPVRPKPARATLEDRTVRDRLILKLAEGSRVRLRGGHFVVDTSQMTPTDAERLARSGLEAADLDAELAGLESTLAIPGVAVRRSFSRPEADLDQEQSRGERILGEELADLNLYYRVSLPELSDADIETLLDALNASPLVEQAYAPGKLVRPGSPSYVSNQTYLNAAPQGMDVNYSWTLPGGNGAGVRVIDVEAGWNFSHEDLPPMFAKLGTFTTPPPDTVQHGTGVLGIIGAVKNSFGVTGIANGATIGVSSDADDVLQVALAINNAVARLFPGDVILLEVARRGPVSGITCDPTCVCDDGQYETLPAEWDDMTFDAIRTATSRSISVVEAAGNGHMNLDSSLYNRRFDRSFRDSGAVMVGGTMSDTRTPHCRTNYGSRVDVSAWAENIMTTGNTLTTAHGTNTNLPTNGTDPNVWYRTGFTGTSGASALLAGVVADVAGARLGQLLAPLSSFEMRSLLGRTGQPQPTPVTKQVGPMPNLRNALSPTNDVAMPYEPPATGNVVAVRQSIDVTSALAVGTDGALSVRAAVKGDVALGPWPITSTGFAPPGAGITYGRRNGSAELDAFFVGNDGKLYVTKETNDSAWSSPVALTAASFAPPGARVAVGYQSGTQLQIDVFVVATGGTIKVVSALGSGAWSTPRSVSAANFAPAGAALATGTQGVDQLDVFVVANDSHLKVFAVTNQGAWAGPYPIGGTNDTAPPGAPLASGHQAGGYQLDLFTVNNSGALIAFAVGGKGAWSGVVPLTGTSFTVKNADVSTVELPSGQLDVFLVTANGTVGMMSVVGVGAFAGPFALSAPGVAVAGAKTSAATQWTADTNTTQLDLVTVGKNGLLMTGTVGTVWLPQIPLR